MVFIDVDVADADAVAGVVVVGHRVFCAGECGQVAVCGAVDKCFCVDSFSAGAAFGDYAFYAGAVHDGGGEAGVDKSENGGFFEHLHGCEFIEFGVDCGADGVEVDAFGHLGVAGAAADFYHAFDDFVWDSVDDLAFGDVEMLPEVVEAVQCGSAFDAGSAGVAFDFDEHCLCALTSGGKGCDDAGCTSACDYDIHMPDGEVFGGFLVGIFGLFYLRFGARCGSACEQ